MTVNLLGFTRANALSVVQFATNYRNTVAYLSGNVAIRENLITIAEVDKAGSINRLVVINESDQMVFLMDGDILMGAKQNRVLNASVLLAPKSKTILPVSCVEEGRWSHRTETFSNTDRTVPHSIRAVKAKDVKMNLEQTQMFDSDQSKVWSSVLMCSMEMDHESATSDLNEILEEKENILSELTSQFEPLLKANGMAVFIGSTLLNIDIFNQSGIFEEYFPRLLKSAAADAMHKTDQEALKKTEAEYKTLDFLDHISFNDSEKHPAIGVGVERRIENNEITGFELSYTNYPIHTALLRLEEEIDPSFLPTIF